VKNIMAQIDNPIKKGVILAGGTGSRLRPSTAVVNKHLLSVFDKPMIYYPLTTLILAGCNDIAIVCNDDDLTNFKALLGDGRKFGIMLSYFSQDGAEGLTHALKSCQAHWSSNEFVAILGDNLFYGASISITLSSLWSTSQACVIGYEVAEPERFGVIEFDANNSVISIEEKPDKPKSNIIATGLYKFTKNLDDLIDNVSRSQRGEFEITDLLNLYIQQENLDIIKLKRGYTWLDMGTVQDMHSASNFISAIQTMQGFIIGSPEEAAFRMGKIDKHFLNEMCLGMKSNYYNYLMSLSKHD